MPATANKPSAFAPPCAPAGCPRGAAALSSTRTASRRKRAMTGPAPHRPRRILTTVIRTQPQSDREVFENALLWRNRRRPDHSRVVHMPPTAAGTGPKSSGKTNLCQQGDGFLSPAFYFTRLNQWLDFLCPFFGHSRQSDSFFGRPRSGAGLFNKVTHRFGGYLTPPGPARRNRAGFIRAGQT